MSLKNKFGAETYRARTGLGLTQEQVAEAIDKSTRSIQYIEKGAWLPKSETMLQIMIVLQIDPMVFSKEVKVRVPVYPVERAVVRS